MTTTDLQAIRALNAAVLSDTLDSLGLMQQAMKPFMRPLDDTLQLIGRARTGLYMPVYAPPAKARTPTRSRSRSSTTSCRGDVVVLACDGPTDASLRGASCCPPRPWRAARPAA